MRPHSPRTHAQCEQIGKRGISEILALIGHLLIVELDDQDVRARPCSVRFAILECISANSVSIERLPVRCGFHPLHDLFCLMLAGATWPSATHAQVSIDMARVTCADYLALSAADSAVFSAWMGGWFNQKTGHVFVDLNAYARNVASVNSWCASNPTQTVMAGLQRATVR